MFDNDKNNQNNKNNENQNFPTGYSQISNPNWLFGKGEPHHYEIYNSGGIVTVTPKWSV